MHVVLVKIAFCPVGPQNCHLSNAFSTFCSTSSMTTLRFWTHSCGIDPKVPSMMILFFLSSCINKALRDEIKWPSVDESVEAASHVHELPGCIGIIDGTLVKIRRPWRDENDGRYFNGQKKMYCINNLVVVDHFGLFIYVEAGFPGAYHDINVLRRFDLAANWRDFFTHRDEYFEYIIGDPRYQGLEAFVIRRVAPRELEENHDETAVNAYNKIHAGYRVRVE
jgi:hypothetical protein